MKIPLDFTPQKDRISIIGIVRLPPKNLPLPIKFVVDTGSPETFIDEIDLLRFRISAEQYPYSNDMLMGGTKVALHKLGKVNLNFRDSENNLHIVSFNDLKISRSLWTRQNALATGTSIIGMNFLFDTKLHLFVDSSNGIAYFSSEK